MLDWGQTEIAQYLFTFYTAWYDKCMFLILVI